MIDYSIEVEKNIDQKKLGKRDETLLERDKIKAVLRDLLAYGWVQANIPLIMKALEDPVFARENDIHIVLEVDGVPVELVPPQTSPSVTQQNLEDCTQYVRMSLAKLVQGALAADRLKKVTEYYEQELKNVNKRLKKLGMKVSPEVEREMIYEDTKVVIDFSDWENPGVYGIPAGVPSSAIEKKKTFLDPREFELYRRTREPDESAEDEGIDVNPPPSSRSHLRSLDTDNVNNDEDDDDVFTPAGSVSSNQRTTNSPSYSSSSSYGNPTVSSTSTGNANDGQDSDWALSLVREFDKRMNNQTRFSNHNTPTTQPPSHNSTGSSPTDGNRRSGNNSSSESDP